MRRIATLSRLTLPLLLAAALCRVACGDAYDASVRTLERASRLQQDGPSHALLIGLRQLGDPRLRPFFEQLAGSGPWQLQVHGVLGIAELDDPQLIEVDLVRRVDPMAQDAIVAAAIDRELLTPEIIRALLATEDLQAISRLLLMSEMKSHGEQIDAAMLTELARSGNLRAAGLASCMLADLGDQSAFSAHRERMAGLTEQERTRHVIWLLDAIRQDEVEAAMPWVIEQLEHPDAPPGVISRCLLTALELEPQLGIELWRRFLGPQPDHRKLVEYVQLLMATNPSVPATAYDGLVSDDTLLREMIRSGRAISGAEPAVPALIDLFDLNHERSAEWALYAVERLEEAEQIAFYRHVIDGLDDNRARALRMPYAVKAAERLYTIDPQGTLELLATVKDDSAAQEALLIGLFEGDVPGTQEAVASIRRIGAGRADSVALVLLARNAEHLEQSDKHQLGLIASGGGRLSAVLEAQAAWLYIRHTLATQRAFADIFEIDAE